MQIGNCHIIVFLKDGIELCCVYSQFSILSLLCPVVDVECYCCRNLEDPTQLKSKYKKQLQCSFIAMRQESGFHPGEEENLQLPISFLFALTRFLLRDHLLERTFEGHSSFPKKLYDFYLRSFLSEKAEENNDISEQGFKDKAYHCQAPAL